MNSPVEMATLMGSLSLATDLADGFPLEKTLRTTVIAMRLADALGAGDADRVTTFWGTLLRFVGCTAFSFEEKEFAAGDDRQLRNTLAYVDFGRLSSFVGRAVRGIGKHAPLGERARALGRLLTNPEAPREHAEAQCDAGRFVARALGMPADVERILALREERFDGRGPKKRASGDDLPLASRIADVADTAELFLWMHGLGAAEEELRRRRGSHFDPRVVDAFLRDAVDVVRGVRGASAWDAFVASEPAPRRLLSTDADVTQCLRAFSAFSDVASVYTLDHSTRVAERARDAARAAGLSASDVTLVEQAGYVHDLGRVAVPIGVWEKTSPLSPLDRERIRQHSVATETILRLAEPLAPVADLASLTHEREGGTGYHRRVRDADLSRSAKVLAAADVAVALDSERPQRPRLAPAERTRALRSAGLDARAVEAVLAAIGGRAPKRRGPMGLTEREIEVARLVAIGRTNKDIGALLGVSARTAQKHVMNIYDKAGVESRAGLALFAVEHGLLDPTSGGRD
ncbi:MAG: HD domain-containing phosphohydrolase [Polyangiaceae bacterium]